MNFPSTVLTSAPRGKPARRLQPNTLEGLPGFPSRSYFGLILILTPAPSPLSSPRIAPRLAQIPGGYRKRDYEDEQHNDSDKPN